MKLSVIIPAYNEEKRIKKTLERISNYLKQQEYEAEILVVNDGSTDNTAGVVREMKEGIKNLKLTDNEKNKGKGGVVKQGMLEGKGEYLLFTDADNSTDIRQVEKMWPEFEEGADVVIGTRDPRDHKEAKQAVPQPWWKRRVADVGNLIIQLFLLPGIWDTQCGFKAFRKEAAKNLFKLSKGYSWAFDTEIIALAKKLGYEVKIVPVYWVNDPDSRFNLKGYIRFFKEFFQIVWNFWSNKYNLKNE